MNGCYFSMKKINTKKIFSLFNFFATDKMKRKMDWLQQATRSPYPEDHEVDLAIVHGPMPFLQMALCDPRAEAYTPRAYILSEYLSGDVKETSSKKVCRRALDILENERLTRSEDEYQDFIKDMSGHSIGEFNIGVGMIKRGRVKGSKREVHRLVEETFVTISDLPDLEMKEFSNIEMMRTYPGLLEDDERQTYRAHGKDENGEYDYYEGRDETDGSIHYEKTYRPPTRDEYVVWTDSLSVGFWCGKSKWTFRCTRKKHKALPHIIPPYIPDIPDIDDIPELLL